MVLPNTDSHFGCRCYAAVIENRSVRTMVVIETFELTKVYGSKTACAGISLTVKQGQVFGLLGPNGAGKSTFIKMLTGLLYPTSGRAMVLGKPVTDITVRSKIGYLPENFKYQDWMTGQDLLSFHAALYKIDKSRAALRIAEVLKLVKLAGQENLRIGTYSKGMQQRLGIASALLPDPELLFLDEPTSALDPLGRKEVRDLIRDLQGRGKSVLLNSHLLSEVELVCDSAAIINQGRIIVGGSMNEILGGKFTLEIRAQNIGSEVVRRLQAVDPGVSFGNDLITLEIDQLESASEVARIIVENGGKLFSMTPRRANLESRFISLINGEAL
jgi:ABC-2 type transport system ATP-binding protein